MRANRELPNPKVLCKKATNKSFRVRNYIIKRSGIWCTSNVCN